MTTKVPTHLSFYPHDAKKVFRLLWMILLATGFAASGTSQAQTPYSLEAIVKTGDPAPGTGGTFVIPTSTQWIAVARSANGRIAFVASVSGGDVDSGIFVREPDGSLRMVVVADSAGVNGTPLPGFPGTYGIGNPCAGCAGKAERLGAPGIDDNGRVAFVARLVGGNVDKGLYAAEPDGTFKIVALASFNLDDRTTSTPVPGTSGWTIQDFHWARPRDAEAPAMNRNGELAFYALLDGIVEWWWAEANLVAHFADNATVATIRKAVVTGDPAPDPGDPPIGMLANLPYVSLNSHGDVAFDEFPPVPDLARRFFMADAAGHLTRLVQTGDPVASPENATVSDLVLIPQINDDCTDASPSGFRACVTAYFARLQHPDVTNGILLRELDGASRALVLGDEVGLSGTPVPGTSHTFDRLSDPRNLTTTGWFSFGGAFENGCAEGVFSWLGNELVTIAKEGDSVPGFSLPLFRFGPPFLSEENDVVITASLAEKFVGDCYADGSFSAAAGSKELSWSTVNDPQVQLGFAELGDNQQIFSPLPNLPFLGTFLESVLNIPTIESAAVGSEFSWTLKTDSGSTVQFKLVSLEHGPPRGLRFDAQFLVDGVPLANGIGHLRAELPMPFVIRFQEISGINHLLGGLWTWVQLDVTGPEVDALADDELVEIRYAVNGDELARYRLEQVIISSDPVSPAIFLAKPSSELQLELLVELVTSFNLQQGIANSFDAKLQNALQALKAANAGQRQDAANKLMAFINAVEAQRGKEITSEEADQLIAQVMRILSVL